MKKVCMVLCIVVFVVALGIIQIIAAPCGDTNSSGKIDITDALLIAQYYVGQNPSNFDKGAADVNGDNNVNIQDALLVAQYYVGIINSLPCQGSEQTATPIITPSVTGNVTYTLERVSNPTQEQQNAYKLITEAMDKAVSYYNQYTSITKQLYVVYNPSVATADGNINGTIRFGQTQYMNYITGMHEIAHTVGVGTSSRWSSLIQNGIYTGVNATNMLRQLTGDNNAEIHGDSQHFWPYGLNYVSEVESEQDVIFHCKIVNAMKQDGI